VTSSRPQRSAPVTLRTGSQTARRGGDARAICAPARAPRTGGWHSRVRQKTYRSRRRELCRRGQAGGSSGNYRGRSPKVLGRAVKGMGAIADRLLRCACKRRLCGGGNDSVREPMHSLGTSWSGAQASTNPSVYSRYGFRGSKMPNCQTYRDPSTPTRGVGVGEGVPTGTES
jgi:hypothetical protein